MILAVWVVVPYVSVSYKTGNVYLPLSADAGMS